MIRLALILAVMGLLATAADAADLDTRDKRSAGSLPGEPWRGQLPLPDGDVANGDRAHAAGLYRGFVSSGLSVLRASMILPGSPWRAIVPGPDGTVGYGDRQALANLYAGIVASPPPSGGSMPLFRYYYDQMER